MKKSTILLALLAGLLTASGLAAQDRAQLFREAQDLYRNGAYGQARALFDRLGDPLSEAWSILCATRVNSTGHTVLADAYGENEPASIVESRQHLAMAQNYFDGADYENAAREFAMVDPSSLSASEQAECAFKKAYSAYFSGDYNTAITEFVQIQGMPYSTYTAPSCFYLAYMAYSMKDFEIAELWFRKSVRDERFKALSEYYIMECRFMSRDYSYVLENAPSMLDTLPAERHDRMSRMLSESYLVKGQNEKALQYLRQERVPDSRTDLFHAGSVLYAVQDYRGAIENFSRITPRTDSLGQVASYELAYSYIQTGNKVSAASAFKEAAATSFDPAIQEDAAFNYAKLSFDLNGDTAPFDEYISRYTTDRRGEQIYNYMAIAALNRHDYAAAIENYSKIEELDEDQKGNYVKANYLRANQLASGGAWSSAIPYLRAAGFYYPKSDRFNQLSRYWLAEANYNSGNFPEAEKLWQELYNTSALRGSQENALLPYNLGYSYYAEKRYEQAARWFDVYAESGDALNREDALTRRADCDFARHNYKAAIKSYQKVIDEFDSQDNIYPFYQQALAYGLSGQKKSKVSVLGRVRKSSPDAPLYCEAMYELGRAQMENGSYDAAATTFEQLRTTTADNTFAARALIGKGMAYRNMKRYDSALDQYKQVVALVPGSEYSEEALLAINSIYQTTGTPEKYIEFIENNGLDVGKSSAEKESIYFNTAEQIYLAGNYNQAVNYLRKYISDYPDGARRGDATFYLADSYSRLGDKEKACACFEDALKYLKQGSFAESAALNYAVLSFGLERFEDALKGYTRLNDTAQMTENRAIARLGMLRSAYACRNWAEVVNAAGLIENSSDPEAQKREAQFTRARACLAQSKRDEAFAIFAKLAVLTTTDEGAESAYMLIQDSFDRGNYDKAENMVYTYASKFGRQTYWMARSYIVLADTFGARGNTVQAKATLESIRDGYVAASEEDDIMTLVGERLKALQ